MEARGSHMEFIIGSMEARGLSWKLPRTSTEAFVVKTHGSGLASMEVTTSMEVDGSGDRQLPCKDVKNTSSTFHATSMNFNGSHRE